MVHVLLRNECAHNRRPRSKPGLDAPNNKRCNYFRQGGAFGLLFSFNKKGEEPVGRLPCCLPDADSKQLHATAKLAAAGAQEFYSQVNSVNIINFSPSLRATQAFMQKYVFGVFLGGGMLCHGLHTLLVAYALFKNPST